MRPCCDEVRTCSVSSLIRRYYRRLIFNLFRRSFSYESSVVPPNLKPRSSLMMMKLLVPFFVLFVCLLHPGSLHTHTHTRTYKEDIHTLRLDNVFTSSSRRSSHFGWFTGALITLCLLALVNTMTTWQCLNIWNTVIISSSSKKTQSVILVAGSWLSAPTAATPVCHLPGRHGKRAAQKKKCSG